MFELVLLIGACVVMYKVAEFENQSGILWAVATLGLCVLGAYIAPPFVRVLIGLVVAGVLMAVVNMARRT